MTTRNLLSACLAGVSSFGLTLAILAPARLKATSPVPSLALLNQEAKLTIGGIEIRPRTSDESDERISASLKPGRMPAFEFTASNTSNEPAEAKFSIVVTVMDPFSKFGRTISAGREDWRQEQLISLEPRQTKTITMTPETQLAAGNWATVLMRSNDLSITTMSYTVEPESKK